MTFQRSGGRRRGRGGKGEEGEGLRWSPWPGPVRGRGSGAVGWGAQRTGGRPAGPSAGGEARGKRWAGAADLGEKPAAAQGDGPAPATPHGSSALLETHSIKQEEKVRNLYDKMCI